MKIKPRFSSLVFLVGLFFVLASVSNSSADARIDSWFTPYSGRYARIYATTADLNSSNAVSTWSRGSLNQSLPAYSGVQEIYSSASWVYFRTTGLGAHVMGPWYLNAAKTMLFPNVPVNTKSFYRIPRSSTVPGTKTLTGLGAIGYFVDGVAMFDGRDGFFWNGSAEMGGMGSGFWNRDAYVNEGVTFDPANAHQPGSGMYHYHANPIALRYLLGDHIAFNAATKIYSENATNLHHSPIIGWVRDGYPIYGPYGYSVANDANSAVRRMISGFALRNGQNGTDNLSTTGRTSIPSWAARAYNVSTNQTGAPVGTTYPLGRYMEDNAYLGDLSKTQGVDFDLDEYNGRFCVTPEFSAGTYAYFVSVSSNGTPTFPYNIGRAFYGSPTGASVTSLSESVVTNFIGGAESTLQSNAPVLSNSTVTLTWSSVEGGTYKVESKSDINAVWSDRKTNIASQGITTQLVTNKTVGDEFFRPSRTGLANYDPVK